MALTVSAGEMNIVEDTRISPMDSLIALLQGQTTKLVAKGAALITQGERQGRLFVLAKGSVEVSVRGTSICTISKPGAVLGELSALLGTPHNATVKTLEDSEFYVIEDAEKFLVTNPEAGLFIAKVLAKRLSQLDYYFADLKKEFYHVANNAQLLAARQISGADAMSAFWDKAEKGLAQTRHDAG
jgi:CRP-like cAMP-binding protein